MLLRAYNLRIFTPAIILFVFAGCANHYVLRKEDFRCLKHSPVPLEFKGQHKYADFDDICIYTRDGKKICYSKYDIYSWRNHDIIGGELVDTVNPGIGKGANTGALSGAILCFGLALAPGIGSYDLIVLNLAAAVGCTIIGAGLGAIFGSVGSIYRGPARIPNCNLNDTPPSTPENPPANQYPSP